MQYYSGYQPMFSPFQQRPLQAPSYGQTQPEGLIRVTGMDGAKAYPLAPNSIVPLFDSERDVLYVKSADAGGFPTIRAFTFAPMEEFTQQQTADYVTREEFNQLKEMIENGIKPVRKAKQPDAAE